MTGHMRVEYVAKCRGIPNNGVKRAGIAKLTPHCCPHGFATSMLQAGKDPKTVAETGGCKDVATVMKFYAHAMNDPTVTDLLFGTKIDTSQTRKSINYLKLIGKITMVWTLRWGRVARKCATRLPTLSQVQKWR